MRSVDLVIFEPDNSQLHSVMTTEKDRFVVNASAIVPTSHGSNRGTFLMESRCTRCGEEHDSIAMCSGRADFTDIFLLNAKCNICGEEHRPVIGCIGRASIISPSYEPGPSNLASISSPQFPWEAQATQVVLGQALFVLSTRCARCGCDHDSTMACSVGPYVVSLDSRQDSMLASTKYRSVIDDGINLVTSPWEDQYMGVLSHRSNFFAESSCTICGEEHGPVIGCIGRASVTSFSPHQNAMIAPVQERFGIDASLISPTSFWQVQGIGLLSAPDTFLNYNAQSPANMASNVDALSLRDTSFQSTWNGELIWDSSRDSLSFGRLESLGEFADTLADKIMVNVRSVARKQGANVRDIIVQVIVMGNSWTGDIYQIGIETHATDAD